jgi:hypothetical protein
MYRFLVCETVEDTWDRKPSMSSYSLCETTNLDDAFAKIKQFSANKFIIKSVKHIRYYVKEVSPPGVCPSIMKTHYYTE